jgi:ribA/ribD-fused uncharacterized protein
MNSIERFQGRWYFLSNFYPCEIKHQGITYPSVEHFYVAMKSNNDQFINGKYYTSIDFREMIAKIKEPGVVKKLGQKIKVRKDWDEKKLEFMNLAIREKFVDDLAERLLETGSMSIVEGNFWHDNFWGQCSCDKCHGKGKNNLGKILMNVRDELRGNKPQGIESVFQ